MAILASGTVVTWYLDSDRHEASVHCRCWRTRSAPAARRPTGGTALPSKKSIQFSYHCIDFYDQVVDMMDELFKMALVLHGRADHPTLYSNPRKTPILRRLKYIKLGYAFYKNSEYLYMSLIYIDF